MRTSRGLQITSIVVLSPVLLILISLIFILFISIYTQISSIVSTQSLTRTSAEIIILQQQRSFNKKQVKRFRFFSKLKLSPFSLCIIIITYALYILLKRKRNEKKPQQIEKEQEPILIKANNNKKHSKRRKVLKKVHQKAVKKRERSISISSSIEEPVNKQDIEDETEWISVATVKKKIVNNPTCLPSPISPCTTPKFDNTKIDLHLPSPETTPVHSDDEQSSRRNWYSPFITGLDLDIIPKLPQDPLYNKSIFTTNHFKTSTIPSIHQQSRIKLLEIHPFIPSPNSSIHTHHAFGSIGDKRKINNCATSN